MEKLRESPAQILKKVEVKGVEKIHLDRVFGQLIGLQPDKQPYEVDKITIHDLNKVLHFLGAHPTRGELKEMIWEVDDDLDGMISKKEFETMYKRCTIDASGLEP